MGEGIIGNGGGSAVQNLNGSRSVLPWIGDRNTVKRARARLGRFFSLSLALGLVLLLLPVFPHAVRAGTDDNPSETIAALANYVERLDFKQFLPVAADQANPAAAQTLEGLTDVALLTGNQQSQSDWVAQHKLAMAKSLAAMEDPGQVKQGETSRSDWLSQHRQAVSQPFTALADYVQRMGNQRAQPDRSERPAFSATQQYLRLADKAGHDVFKQVLPKSFNPAPISRETRWRRSR